MNFNELIKRCHQQSKDAGWWIVMDGGDTPNFGERYALFHREMYEAYEGVLDPELMDDKLPHRKTEEVELADTVIRICDYMGYRGFEYDDIFKSEIRENVVEFLDALKYKELFVEKIYNIINYKISLGLESLRTQKDELEKNYLSMTMGWVLSYSDNMDYDLETTINEKLEFNKNRADHKLENRQKDGGKKF